MSSEQHYDKFKKQSSAAAEKRKQQTARNKALRDAQREQRDKEKREREQRERDQLERERRERESQEEKDRRERRERELQAEREKEERKWQEHASRANDPYAFVDAGDIGDNMEPRSSQSEYPKRIRFNHRMSVNGTFVGLTAADKPNEDTICKLKVEVADVKSVTIDEDSSSILFDVDWKHLVTRSEAYSSSWKQSAFKETLKKEIQSYRVLLKEWQPLSEQDVDEKVAEYTLKYNRFMLHLSDYIQANLCKAGQLMDEVFRVWFHKQDLNVLFFWRLHMLDCRAYQSDCLKHFGFMLSARNMSDYDLALFHREANATKNDSLQLRVQQQIAGNFTEKRFEAAVKKNIHFMKDVVAIYDELQQPEQQSNRFFEEQIRDYKLFLKYGSRARSEGLHFSPYRTVDFVWHTHLLFPELYFAQHPQWTYENVVVYHSDRFAKKHLEKYRQFRYDLWNVLKNKEIESGYGNYKHDMIEFLFRERKLQNTLETLVFGFVRHFSYRSVAVDALQPEMVFMFYYSGSIPPTKPSKLVYSDNDCDLEC